MVFPGLETESSPGWGSELPQLETLFDSRIEHTRRPGRANRSDPESAVSRAEQITDDAKDLLENRPKACVGFVAPSLGGYRRVLPELWN